MPASLRPCHHTSLGHFSCRSGCRLCTTDKPTAKRQAPTSLAGCKGSPSEKVSVPPSPCVSLLPVAAQATTACGLTLCPTSRTGSALSRTGAAHEFGVGGVHFREDLYTEAREVRQTPPPRLLQRASGSCSTFRGQEGCRGNWLLPHQQGYSALSFLV